MSIAARHQPISVQNYLVGETSATRKHEYVDGNVYAMVGASNTHNRIATNATGILHAQLRGKPCQVFNSDTKIRLRFSRGTRFYYPDVSVVCLPNPPRDSFHDAPAVIVEVISASSRRVDEFEKREAYLSIDSLRAYILVEQSSPAAIVYRRGENGFERETHVGLGETIPLPEIECTLGLTELYEHVEFIPEPSEDECENL